MLVFTSSNIYLDKYQVICINIYNCLLCWHFTSLREVQKLHWLLHLLTLSCLQCKYLKHFFYIFLEAYQTVLSFLLLPQNIIWKSQEEKEKVYLTFLLFLLFFLSSLHYFSVLSIFFSHSLTVHVLFYRTAKTVLSVSPHLRMFWYPLGPEGYFCWIQNSSLIVLLLWHLQKVPFILAFHCFRFQKILPLKLVFLYN